MSKVLGMRVIARLYTLAAALFGTSPAFAQTEDGLTDFDIAMLSLAVIVPATIYIIVKEVRRRRRGRSYSGSSVDSDTGGWSDSDDSSGSGGSFGGGGDSGEW